ncbi:MAG: hypothetical protein LBB09_02475 [Rickettsiales bacterium]|jgi:hypothetical protein|nr:hypothetical protein [Rickettsiales bacterium]
MNTTSDEILSDFMSVKNKEALGEKIDGIGEKGDNFLPDQEKLKQSFTGESINSKESDAYLTARKILNMLVTAPLLLGGLFSAYYILMKILPFTVSFIKKFFAALAK